GGLPDAMARGVGAKCAGDRVLRAVGVRDGRGSRIPAGIRRPTGSDHGTAGARGRITFQRTMPDVSGRAGEVIVWGSSGWTTSASWWNPSIRQSLFSPSLA